MIIVDSKGELCIWTIHCFSNEWDRSSTDAYGMTKVTIVNWGKIDYEECSLIDEKATLGGGADDDAL